MEKKERKKHRSKRKYSKGEKKMYVYVAIPHYVDTLCGNVEVFSSKASAERWVKTYGDKRIDYYIEKHYVRR